MHKRITAEKAFFINENHVTVNKEGELNRPKFWHALLLILFFVVMEIVAALFSMALSLVNRVPLEEIGTSWYWYDALLATISLVMLLFFCYKASINFFSTFRISRKKWVIMLVTFLVMLLLSYAVEYIGTAFGLFSETANEAALQEMFTESSVFVISYLVAIIAPVIEEIVFRGLLTDYLFPKKKWLGFLAGIVAFTLAHIPTDLISFLLYLIPSIGLGYIYFKTRRLELCIIAHFLNNGLSLFLTFLLG